MRKGEPRTPSIIKANGRMRDLIDFEPKVSLEEGLRRTIDFSASFKK